MHFFRLVSFITALFITLALPTTAQASYYITTGDESLSAIAKRTATDAELLAAINNCETELILPAGQLLTLPDQPALIITVQDGDTLSSIARSCGVSVSKLSSANGLNGSLIFPGQTLTIPFEEETTSFSNNVFDVEMVQVMATSSRSTAMVWPTEGVITSLFGPRGNGYHYGLDIASDSQTPINAVLAGRVIEAGWKNDAYGYAVMIDHGNGCVTLYGHCEKLLVKVGDTVIQGQIIALMGSTGHSTGPHVHFEVRINGSCENPSEYLR